jgi:hypothetical protein
VHSSWLLLGSAARVANGVLEDAVSQLACEIREAESRIVVSADDMRVGGAVLFNIRAILLETALLIAQTQDAELACHLAPGASCWWYVVVRFSDVAIMATVRLESCSYGNDCCLWRGSILWRCCACS